MKKKLMFALIVAGVATAALGFAPSVARASGEPCTTAHGKSGYMVASGENGEPVCVAEGSE